MTIRTRIVAGVTALAIVVLALSGVGTVLVLRQRLIESIDAGMAVQGGGGLQGVFRGGFRPDVGQFDRVFEERDVAVMLVTPEGEAIVIPSGSLEDPDPLPDVDIYELPNGLAPFTVNAVEGDLRYRVTVHRVGGGRVVLATSLEETDDAARSLALVVTAVGVIAVAVLAAAGGWIVRRGLSPIDSMIETAEGVGDGTLSERVAVVDPDTEVGHLAAAINGMLGRVEDAIAVREASEARLRRFASDASHELRTPLTSILGYAELYRRGGSDPDQVEKSFGRIESEGGRMARMLEDLLVLTRLDQGASLAVTEVDLREVVTDAVGDARAVEPDRPFDVDVPDAAVWVRGDEDRLRQVVGNLLANVRDHTSPDTSVALGLAATRQEVRLVVTDRGPGMPDEILDVAFDRFARANSAGPGSGLGLSIVRSIVEAHGGTVGLESGDGTTVTLVFPVSP